MNTKENLQLVIEDIQTFLELPRDYDAKEYFDSILTVLEQIKESL